MYRDGIMHREILRENHHEERGVPGDAKADLG